MAKANILLVYDPHHSSVDSMHQILTDNDFKTSIVNVPEWNALAVNPSTRDPEYFKLNHPSNQTILTTLATKFKSDTYDLAFVDGALAYVLELRSSLQQKGIEHPPILVADPLFIPEWVEYRHNPSKNKNLYRSGCDFGRITILPDNSNGPVQIAQALLAHPMRTLEGLVHNPNLYLSVGGTYLHNHTAHKSVRHRD